MNASEPEKSAESKQPDSLKRLSTGMKGLAVASMISGYILGPLLLLGGGGWILTDRYDNKAFVLVGVGMAFILTNVLILRSTRKLTKRL